MDQKGFSTRTQPLHHLVEEGDTATMPPALLTQHSLVRLCLYMENGEKTEQLNTGKCRRGVLNWSLHSEHLREQKYISHLQSVLGDSSQNCFGSSLLFK